MLKENLALGGASPISVLSELPHSEPLTPELAGRILYLSFKFSQGSQELQNKIFSYIHGQNPDWRIDNGLKTEAISSTERSVSKTILPSIMPYNPAVSVLHERRSDTLSLHSFKDTYKSVFDSFKMIINGPVSEDQSLTAEITDGIIIQDFKYLITNGGRDRVNIPAGKELVPAYDKFLSHLIYYGLEGNPTGLSVYDSMFSDIRDYLFDNYNELPEHIRYSLSQLVSVYETHHPGSKINLP